MEERISIIMASYNYADYISEAMESVINQTYKNWELIIVDDSSSDNSVEIIKEFEKQDSRIKLIVNSENFGLAKTLQKGLKAATGEWIAFLESDDVFYPDSIREKADAIKNGAGIIYTDLEIFGKSKNFNRYKKHLDDVNKYFIKSNDSKFIENFKNIIPKVNPIPTFSVVMAKKDLLEACDFNSICKASLDYYLWAQLSCETKVFYINKKLTKWRLHDDSYINRSKNSWVKEYLFFVSLYAQTIKDKPFFVRLFLTLNFVRARIIYIKLDKTKFKINFLNNKFIYEKSFKTND